MLREVVYDANVPQLSVSFEISRKMCSEKKVLKLFILSYIQEGVFWIWIQFHKYSPSLNLFSLLIQEKANDTLAKTFIINKMIKIISEKELEL